MSNYGLVYRDECSGCIMLGEFNDKGIIEDFIEIRDRKYNTLPSTMFSVVDVRRAGERLSLLDLHQFEMFEEEGIAEPSARVISLLFGMDDHGAAWFQQIFEAITDELFSGTKQ